MDTDDLVITDDGLVICVLVISEKTLNEDKLWNMGARQGCAIEAIHDWAYSPKQGTPSMFVRW